MEEIIKKIRLERIQQNAKWGEQNHNDEKWLMIAAEEFGEIAKGCLENDQPNVDTEIVQLAAVLVAWAEARGRRG